MFRLRHVWVVGGLLLGVWWFAGIRRAGDAWIRPVGAAWPPVKILQFHANVGSLTKGEKALLCYGVENARSVTISPTVDGVYPALNRCVPILPEHTTHYLLMAVGYDGKVATQSFILPVDTGSSPPLTVNYASVP